MEIKLTPIAIVKNSRTTPIDDNWEEVIAEIELAESIPTEAFEKGIFKTDKACYNRKFEPYYQRNTK